MGSVARVQGIAGMVQNLPGMATGLVSQLASRLEAMAMGAVNALIHHVSSQISGLMANASIYMAQLGIRDACSGGGLSAGCDGINNFFGSILGGATAALGQINAMVGQVNAMVDGVVSGALGAVDNVVNSVMSVANSAISTATDMAAGITNMVANEISSLQDGLSQLLGFANARSAASLFDSPCGRMLISAVGSTQLLSSLQARR
jgi:phage-related protein